MKKLFVVFGILLLSINLHAQSPHKLSYQCVVRNAAGELVVNQEINILISIIQGTPTGSVVYQETYDPNPETNANGLVSIEIGNGTPVIGSLSTINWANGPYYLKTEIDPTGGTNFTIVGTSQLLSVPYAIYAEKSGDAFSKDYNDLYNRPTNISNFNNDVGYITEITEGDPVFIAHPAYGISSTNITNWDLAYSWGDHSSAGYLKSFNESDPVYTASPSSGISSTDISNWNTAYGWGNHASEGYATKDMQNERIINLGDPVNDQDAVNKKYINSLLERIQYLEGLNRIEEPVYDYEGNEYKTVRIGSQVWMAENLKTKYYSDGTEITQYYSANNNTSNDEIYGLLYTWNVVMNGASSSNTNPSNVQGVCPTGWHVPSQAEFDQLAYTLGGYDVAGGKMKDVVQNLWDGDNWSTNESNFSAVPAGSMDPPSTVYSFRERALVWSSTEFDVNRSISVEMHYAWWNLNTYNGLKQYAFSVRCVKNE